MHLGSLNHIPLHGMVERFNCSSFQLLRTYIETESDWEKHLSLALYAYRTAVHASTGVSRTVTTYSHVW